MSAQKRQELEKLNRIFNEILAAIRAGKPRPAVVEAYNKWKRSKSERSETTAHNE